MDNNTWTDRRVSDDLLEAAKKATSSFQSRLDAISEDKGDKEKFQKVFKATMKKFGIDDITDLKSDAEKKKFFDAVDAAFKSDDEESGKDVEPEDKVKKEDKKVKAEQDDEDEDDEDDGKEVKKEEVEVTLSTEEEKRIEEILKKQSE